MATNRAMTLNQRFGVGFWHKSDAEAFAGHETARLNYEHAVTEHPIHGTRVVVFDVAPRARQEIAA